MTCRVLLATAALITLSGCSYFAHTALQDIRIETPGAQNAVCYMYVDGLRYKYRPPQTMTITKSKEDLVVDCVAPGNRRRKVVIEPLRDLHAKGNAVTGVLPGMAWDYASEAGFFYPELIEVDFNGAPLASEALPQHNNPDIRQPETYQLEEFTPGSPRLNEDRYAPKIPLEKRKKPSEKQSYSGGQVDDSSVQQTSPPLISKSDLRDVLSSLFAEPAEASSGDDAVQTPPPAAAAPQGL